MKLTEIPRRAFLKLSLLFSGGITLVGMFRFLSHETAPKTATRVMLEDPDSYPQGAVVPLPEVQAWLLRDEEGLYALSGECTHLGCIVRAADGQFECPCHGSQFDLKGAVLQGPAMTSLRHVELTRSPDNLLVIDTQVTVPASQRLS